MADNADANAYKSMQMNTRDASAYERIRSNTTVSEGIATKNNISENNSADVKNKSVQGVVSDASAYGGMRSHAAADTAQDFNSAEMPTVEITENQELS